MSGPAAPARGPAQDDSDPAASPAPTLDEVRRRLPELSRAALLAGHAELAAALSQAHVLACGGGSLTLAASPAKSATLADPARLNTLRGLLRRTFGHDLQIAVSATSAPEEPTDRIERYAKAMKHPLVQALLKDLDGDIIAREALTREEWLERFEKL